MKYSIGAVRPLMLGLVGAAAMMSPAIAQDVMGFYKDKTVTMTMGTRPGGSFQVYAQVFARHMP